MPLPLYQIKVLKVEKLSVDLEIKSNFSDSVYAWPGLALRVLSESPGSPLLA